MIRLTLALLVTLTPFTAQAASYSFTWQGANGYRIEGAFSIPDRLVKTDYVSQTHVECFRIQGLHLDKSIGIWGLAQLTPETNWKFNFEPVNLVIRTGGSSARSRFGQEWNMNGRGNNCGKGQIGFNSGTAAQDICLDNKLIYASQVPSNTPLQARRNDEIEFSRNDCEYALTS